MAIMISRWSIIGFGVFVFLLRLKIFFEKFVMSFEKKSYFCAAILFFRNNPTETTYHLCFECPFTLDVFAHLVDNFEWHIFLRGSICWSSLLFFRL